MRRELTATGNEDDVGELLAAKRRWLAIFLPPFSWLPGHHRMARRIVGLDVANILGQQAGSAEERNRVVHVDQIVRLGRAAQPSLY